jgi:hypothetical protein
VKQTGGFGEGFGEAKRDTQNPSPNPMFCQRFF